MQIVDRTQCTSVTASFQRQNYADNKAAFKFYWKIFYPVTLAKQLQKVFTRLFSIDVTKAPLLMRRQFVETEVSFAARANISRVWYFSFNISVIAQSEIDCISAFSIEKELGKTFKVEQNPGLRSFLILLRPGTKEFANLLRSWKILGKIL